MNNFLSIVWYKILPPIYGGQKGIAMFNKYLGKKQNLICLCSRDNQPDGELSYVLRNELPISKLQFWNPIVRKKILATIQKENISHVIVEHPYHGWLGNHKKKQGFTFIVHAHNIEHLRMKIKGRLWWPIVKYMEKKAFRNADLILFKTQHDLDNAIKIFNCDPESCHLVPYGISTSPVRVEDATRSIFREKLGVNENESLLLFAGSFDYAPNLEALRNLTGNIIPKLRSLKIQFRILICGAMSGKQKEEIDAIHEIITAGEVEDMQEYFKNCDLFLNPVVTGSGIQTKNIDALANGLPVICSPFSAIGLPTYLHNKGVMIAKENDWNSFVECIKQALKTPQVVAEEFYPDYNWETIIERFLARLKRKG